MSTAAAAASTSLGQLSRSIGDVKMQIMDIGIVSGDTGATATATGLSRVDYAILIADVTQTAVATYSQNVATFTFDDPVATIKGSVLLFGR
jgi:hypothetical protein